MKTKLVDQRFQELVANRLRAPVYVQTSLSDEELKQQAEQFADELINSGSLRPGAVDTLTSNSPEYKAAIAFFSILGTSLSPERRTSYEVSIYGRRKILSEPSHEVRAGELIFPSE